MSLLRAKADEDCTPEVVLYIANAAFDFAVYLIERKDFKSAFQLLGSELSIIYDLASELGCLGELRQLARSHKLFLGDLTMNGVTRPITLEADFKSGDDVSAKAHIKRSDFNMTALSYLVGDEIEIQILAELVEK